jgi:hypothetical protein
MENIPGSLDGLCDHMLVTQVALDEIDGIDNVGEPIGISGREIIDDPDGCAVGSKSSDEMRTNESRASGYYIVDCHISDFNRFPSLLLQFAKNKSTLHMPRDRNASAELIQSRPATTG